jgi:hypothetical protein
MSSSNKDAPSEPALCVCLVILIYYKAIGSNREHSDVSTRTQRLRLSRLILNVSAAVCTKRN